MFGWRFMFGNRNALYDHEKKPHSREREDERASSEQTRLHGYLRSNQSFIANPAAVSIDSNIKCLRRLKQSDLTQ